ncbi:MAG: crosslink repair DNA glycosylase YcaQ family protein [Vicinamibacterales bacterium]
MSDPLGLFHDATRAWFAASFDAPTPAQASAWASIARGESTLVLAPTGSGKTLAAFLWCINRLMFEPAPDARRRCRVVYVSPLKALAVDVERNLRSPVNGIANLASARGLDHRLPTIAVRTGDTPGTERARFRRESADILITTPESLYLLLTSGARESLRHVDTVIIDEIHALVPTKRGAHLSLSIERLAHLVGQPLQRIGLSATQRPLDEVARFLGGAAPVQEDAPARGRRAAAARATADASGFAFRPVSIVEGGRRKALDLRIEVPVEDMAQLTRVPDIPSGPASASPAPPSIWSAIYPKLLELVEAHRSTLMFVNGRRQAERLAGALNELAGQTLVRAHHGSLARAQRIDVEDSLKAGTLRGLVATSSLELGIDMGAIDLVVQIEAPPSVASGLQRIGRAGHHVDATSRGVLFPKYRGDLVACAAVTRAMRDGRVEATHYPRNPLDIVAQQLVAMVSMDDWDVDALYATVRSAAPFAELTRAMFESVLDMLSGRYPSDDFAELRPRVTWDRVGGRVAPREGAKRVAIVNGGTIPDRGLYGVFLAGAESGRARVGELDEEMVFESRVGETFVLGASTWRIEEITHDRVVVSPAPGELGKMPFWKGDRPSRPIEFGRAIGALVRELTHVPAPAAVDRLERDHDLDRVAAENLVAYLAAQRAATDAVPDEATLVVERYRDELGEWRLCVLSPLGGQVLAPWSLAVVARVRETLGLDVETLWADDGFVVRFPDTDDPPDVSLVLPPPEDVEALVVRQLGSSAMFAARFRECAARALLLPKRRPGSRAPLWQQRKRAADLLAVAAQFGSFPIVLEAFRECLRDIFDMPALVETMRDIAARRIQVVPVDSATPSPFASALLFGYVANYIYDGDAPLSERRAHALAIDQSQLRELLGDIELRELLDAEAIRAVEHELQGLADPSRVATADAVHDLLLRLGDQTRAELAARSKEGRAAGLVDELARVRRVVELPIAGELRAVAVEDAARYRDALGVPLPPGLPEALLAPTGDALRELVRRYARTHGPFTTDDCAKRFGIGRGQAGAVLERLLRGGKILEGEFRPDSLSREWCDPGVLTHVRRRSLARLRREIEPVDPNVLGRLLTTWQGVVRPRRGLDALLDCLESLQGAPLAASILETDILPARVEGYRPADLDALIAAGEIVWRGVEPLGDRDGRVALFLADHARTLFRPRGADARAAARPPTDESRESRILDALASRGALFFGPLHDAIGAGYPGETIAALWSLVWRGLVTNDSMQALRAFTRPPERQRRVHDAGRVFRSRRATPPEASGRWSLVPEVADPTMAHDRATRPESLSRADTAWSAATAQQLLARYGIVTREVAQAEALPGGFSAVYSVLKTMDERGRVRRGYFVSGVAATQFALPAALDLLRSLRTPADEPESVLLSVTDPANPHGTLLPWPTHASDGRPVGRGPTRSVGASVVLVDGAVAAYLTRGQRQLMTFLPEDEPERSRVAGALARRLADLALVGDRRQGGLLIAELDGEPPHAHPLAPYLEDAGFVRSGLGYQRLRQRTAEPSPAHRSDEADAHARAEDRYRVARGSRRPRA